MMNLPRRIGRATALLGVGFALIAPAAQAADSPLLRGSAQRSGAYEEKVAPPLSLLWRFTGGAQPKNPCSPAIVGDTAYFATGGSAGGGGVVYALDVKTGAQKWRYPSEGGLANNIFLTAPLVNEGFVYIGASDGNLYMLNSASGELVRTFRTGARIASSPLLTSGNLFFGSDDNIFYAIEPATGKYIWRQQYRAADNINSAPLLADGMLFFTSADQHIHAVNAATGIGKWRFRLPYVVRDNAPIFADNALFIPAGPRLMSFQPRGGNLRWQVTFPNDIAVPPVAEGGVIYAIDRDKKVYALRTNNGREVWEKPVELPYDAAAAPTISGDVIYVPTGRNLVYALSRTDGKVLWDYAIEPSAAIPPTGVMRATPPTFTTISAPIVIANGAVYVLSDDGSLSAFRPDAPDTTAPLADNLFPKPGSMVSGAPPLTFAAQVDDPGSGLDSESVKLMLNDQELDATFDVARNLIYFQTSPRAGSVNPPLPNGRHTVTLLAKDWRGNTKEEKWSFVVDNTLPTSVNREQAAPAAPRGVGARQQGGGRQGARPGGNRPGGQGNQPGGRRGGQRGGPGGPPPPPL